jgi:hypothetical protein
MKLPPQTASVNRTTAARFLPFPDAEYGGITPSATVCQLGSVDQNCSNLSLKCCKANGFGVDQSSCSGGGSNGERRAQ